MKELATGKITEQHIENIRNRNVAIAREAEIPLAECPEARKPFPTEEREDGGVSKVPEGHPTDDWFDDTFWLTTQQKEDVVKKNTLPPPDSQSKDQPVRRVSPRRKTTNPIQ